MDLAKCAHCGGDYTHHYAVEVFDRTEDDDKGSHVFVGTPGNNEITPLSSGFEVRSKSDAPMGKGSENPSSRRHGVVMKLMCEECEGITAIRVGQHKGSTTIEFAKAKADPMDAYRFQAARTSERAAIIDAENEHKLQYSNWADRESVRIRNRRALELVGFSTDEIRPGIVLVDGAYEVALRSMKWRKPGGHTWYRFASAMGLRETLYG